MKKIINHSILILLVVNLSACGESLTGRKQVTLIPEGKLQELGINTFQQVKRSKKIETDQRILRYVHCMTERLALNGMISMMVAPWIVQMTYQED